MGVRVILLLPVKMKLVVGLLFISLSTILPTSPLLLPHAGFKKSNSTNCNPSNRSSTPGGPENGKALRHVRGELGKLNRQRRKIKRACSRYQRIQLRKRERNLCSNSRRESALSGKKMCSRINE